MISSNNNSIPVVILDDEPAAIRSLELPLLAAGFETILTFSSGRELLAEFAGGNAVLLLDLFMPDFTGERVMEEVKNRWPDTEVIIVTGDNRIDKAVELMRMGAIDYLVKPVEEARLVASVTKAAELLELRSTNDRLKHRLLSGELQNPEAFSKIITSSDIMLGVFRYLEVMAQTSQPVLISGETGTGKELLAEALHILSSRKGNYVKVNVAGLDDTMFSDSLFGHFKGAFTGAGSRRAGLLEQAAGGTILLDEMGSLSQQSQVKLLRLLQDNEFYPLGADVPRRNSARIVAVTNKNLQDLQDNGTFRSDLYYRLRSHHLHIPPLRERKEDIPALLKHFIGEASAELGKEPPTPHPAVLSLLSSYHFPGNIRELRAMVFEAVSKHANHMLDTEVFATYIPGGLPTPSETSASELRELLKTLSSLPTLKQIDTELVEEALERSGNNQSLAARMLGITPSALNKRLRK